MNDAHTHMHSRDSAHDLSVKLSPCLCSCPGWKMAAFSLCVVTCMVCVPQPTTKSRVCCSLRLVPTILCISVVFGYEVHLYVLSLYVKDEWCRHIVGKLWEKMAV